MILATEAIDPEDGTFRWGGWGSICGRTDGPWIIGTMGHESYCVGPPDDLLKRTVSIDTDGWITLYEPGSRNFWHAGIDGQWKKV